MASRQDLGLRKFLAPEFIFGEDARRKAGLYCKNFGAQNVLLVTDPGVMKTPWLNDVVESLTANDIPYHVYSSISPNPRDYEVMQGADFYLEKHCDILLALGGGSVIDAAKGIGIVSMNHKHIDYFEGVDRIQSPMPPLVCIPTTGGTAADVSQFAIINNIKERYKMAIISKTAVPDVSLIDPVTLTSMDPFLTACTGMDVLSHAIEAFTSNANSAITDLNALEAIRLIKDHLPVTVSEPDNLEARSQVALASLYAGLAFSNASLGCVHSLAHSLGGFLDLPHGECNAILLPHVVDYNFKFATDRYRVIAENLGIDVKSLSSTQLKTALINHLIEFKKELGIRAVLHEKGVQTDEIPQLASKAINDPCNATNPRPPREKDLAVIYKEAW